MNTMSASMLRKAEKRLCGRNPTAEKLYIVCEVLFGCLLGVLGLVSVVLYDESEDSSVYIAFAAITLFILMMFGVLLFFLIDHAQTVRYLTRQYKSLPATKREELLALAGQYDRRSGLLYNETYLYGEMLPGLGKSGRYHRISHFQYIEYERLIGVQRVRSWMANNNMYGTMETKYGRLSQGMLQIYDGSGAWHEACPRGYDYELLYQIIARKNPRCRLSSNMK